MPNDTQDWASNFAQFQTQISVVNGAASSSGSIAVPGGAQAALLSVLTSNINNLTITGHQSGSPYLPAVAPPPGLISLFLYDPRDTTLDYVIGHVSTNPTDKVDVSFIGAVSADVTDRVGRQLGKTSPLSFDWTVQGTFTNGAASISSGAPPAGQSIVVAAYSSRVLLTAAGSYANDITFSDGTTTLWRDGLAVNAADVADHCRQSGLGLEGAVGAAVTMTSSVNPGPSVVLSLAMGGYFE